MFRFFLIVLGLLDWWSGLRRGRVEERTGAREQWRKGDKEEWKGGEDDMERRGKVLPQHQRASGFERERERESMRMCVYSAFYRAPVYIPKVIGSNFRQLKWAGAEVKATCKRFLGLKWIPLPSTGGSPLVSVCDAT